MSILPYKLHSRDLHLGPPLHALGTVGTGASSRLHAARNAPC